MFVLRKHMFTLLIAAVLAAGCGDKQEGAEATSDKATQVAARVDGTEITVHQVNYALQRIPNLDKEQTKAASLQVVKGLVDQQLLVKKAETDKLDRDPAVVQALDAARRQILAEAYMSRKLGTPAEPTEAEVNDYFTKHPELFSNRKIFRLQEILIKAPKDKHETIRAQLMASKTLKDFGDWLKSQNIAARAGQGVKPAEQLPLEILPRLAQMPDGQAMVVNTPDGLLVLVVADTQTQPVNLDQARPAIVRMLQQQARQKAAKAELDALRAAAKIEYVGEFADAGKEATAPVAVDAAKSAAETAPAGDADAISKGLSGLK